MRALQTFANTLAFAAGLLITIPAQADLTDHTVTCAVNPDASCSPTQGAVSVQFIVNQDGTGSQLWAVQFDPLGLTIYNIFGADIEGAGAFTFTDVTLPFASFLVGGYTVQNFALSDVTLASGVLTVDNSFVNWPVDSTLRIFVDSDQDAAPVPEPATLALLGLGLAGIAAFRRRRTH